MNEIDPIYKELATKLGCGDSKYMPRILAKLANLEQAEIIRELPAPSEEIANKLNLDKTVVDGHIQELIEKGLVFPTKKGPQMARNLMQLHDASLLNTKFDKALGHEFFDLFKEMMDTEMLSSMTDVMAGGERPMARVIPRWKSIKDIPGVLPCEDVREIIKSQDSLALVHCSCKREHRQRECQSPTEVCINVGRTAQYNISRGAGRQLTGEEALQLMERTDELPLIHVSLNQTAVNQLICNCHWCCCALLRPMFHQNKYKVYDGIAKSRFEAVVDPEKCVGCKTCMDRCQFAAVQMKYYPEIGEERSYTDTEKCMGCGSCVISCPAEARAMKLVRPPEHIPEAAAGIY